MTGSLYIKYTLQQQRKYNPKYQIGEGHSHIIYQKDKSKQYEIEIRNVEDWNGTKYVEVYKAPINFTDAYWGIKLNIMAQPGNKFDVWWPHRTHLYYKEIPESAIQQEIKKQAEIICNKLINGYVQKYEKRLKSNVPIGIRKYIVLYLMVEMCIIKDFYFENKQLVDSMDIPQSLWRTEWKSKWTGPTGAKYRSNQQL